MWVCLAVLCALASACRQVPVEPPEEVGPFQATGTLSTDHNDVASAVAVGEQGDVFVAGVQAYDAASPYGIGRGEQLRGFLNRYGVLGEGLVWQTIIDPPCPKRLRSGEDADLCAARIADLEVVGGDLYVAVETVSRGEVETGRPVAYTFKYDADGDLLWQKSLTSATASRPLSLAGAPDGSIYVLWQEYGATPDGPIRGAFVGVYLGKLSASGEGEWFVELEQVPSYEAGGAASPYREVADVATLGETVLVASSSALQAFSATGEWLWQTPLEDAPTDTATLEVGERFYTRTELVTGGDRVYVGRSSLEYRGDPPPVAPRLDLMALSGTGEAVWRETFGDETTDISDVRLAADGAGRLTVVGTSQARVPEGSSGPFNFLGTYLTQSSSVDRKRLGLLGAVQDLGIANDAIYMVGVTNFNDRAGMRSTDAFLSVASPGGLQTQK